MAASRSGGRNPLELFAPSTTGVPQAEEVQTIDGERVAVVENEIQEVRKEESKNPEFMNPGFNKSGIVEIEDRLYPLSVRIPEWLNDRLDEAVKQTRRSMGRKVPKEDMVTMALESMLTKVQAGGGWSNFQTVDQLRSFMGLPISESKGK